MGKQKIESPSLSAIISGDDITNHYLGLGSAENKFKIFRYNQEVFAVRFDADQKPVDYVSMWHSHKGEEKLEQGQHELLGRGVQGAVYKKTEDKAFKQRGFANSGKLKSESEILEYKIYLSKSNTEILEQKFLLKEQNIEQSFVLGLWNIKDKPIFIMPKVNAELPTGFKKDDFKPLFDEFIIELKTLNESGFSHPDLANNHYHISPQNMLRTTQGVKLIDLDFGFFPYKKYAEEKSSNPTLRDKAYISGRDQWLYVYNDRRTNLSLPQGLKPKGIEQWYEKHPGEAISDNPKALMTLYKQGFITLPKSLVHEMHLKNSQEAVSEYHSGSMENRKHTFHEVSTADFKFADFKQEYKGLRGDALKRTILKELKDSLEEVTTEEELKTVKANFFKSEEMKIIDTAQDRSTKILGKLGLKHTDSHMAVEKIFKEAKVRILELSSVSKNRL
ncbi:MAG: hypothetical protein J0I93_08750 [Legionella sp.]|nr:hypothetical protein [Legionella sp.]